MARLGFIKKVYAILTVQLAITVGWCAIALTSKGVQNFILENMGLFWPILIVQFASLIALVCCGDMAKKVPYNYVLLTLFTLAEAYLVSICCMAYDPTIVLIAAGMTLGITIALTVYACTTTTDFTISMGAMINALFCLIFLGLIGMFWHNYWLETAISALGVFVYGMFIIIDTQMIADGKRHSISTEDYVIGALMLYIDIIGMFLYLLRLLGNSNNN